MPKPPAVPANALSPPSSSLLLFSSSYLSLIRRAREILPDISFRCECVLELSLFRAFDSDSPAEVEKDNVGSAQDLAYL